MMSSREIQVIFESTFMTLDKAGVRKYFKTFEIEHFLNEALFEYFSRLVHSFEVDEKSRKALIKYTNRKELNIYTGTDAPPKLNIRSTFFNISEISDDSINIVDEQLNINGILISVKPITHDYYSANIKNKYKKPSDELGWRIDISNNNIKFHEIIYDGNITNYQITYVIVPDKISIQTNSKIYLPKDNIYDIVNMAVSLAIKSIGTKSESNDSNKKE